MKYICDTANKCGQLLQSCRHKEEHEREKPCIDIHCRALNYQKVHCVEFYDELPNIDIESMSEHFEELYIEEHIV